LYGIWCHYHDSRTQPCALDGVQCLLCKSGNRKRWYGYLPVLGRADGKIWIAEVTAEAAQHCPTLKESGLSLRGLTLTLERRGQSKRSPVVISFEAATLRREPPAPIDTLAALNRIWSSVPCKLAQVDANSKEGVNP